jgi:hypothetical protein
MRNSVQRRQAQIDGGQDFAAGRTQALSEKHERRQGGQTLPTLDGADVCATERVADIGL